MSLESVIADHAAALRELADAIRGANTGAAVPATAKTEAKAEKSKAPKAEAAPAATQKPKVEDAVAEVEEEAADLGAEVTLDDVKRVTIALGKAGKRDALVAKLGELGVAKATELDEDQYAGYVTWATAQLEA